MQVFTAYYLCLYCYTVEHDRTKTTFSLSLFSLFLTHPSTGSAPSGGSQASDDIRFIKKPSNLSNSDNKIKSELPSEDMEDQYEPLVDTSMDDLFSNSQHPPIQLPLDYQLHTRHRLVVPKKVKVVKDEPMDFTDSSAAMVDSKETKSLTLAKAMVAPPSQVKTHQINVADLFTPTDVS